MVQYKKGSLVADDIHDLRTKFQNLVSKVESRSSANKIDATLKKFCELQVWLVDNKIKQNSSAKRSLEEAVRFVDFLKEDEISSTNIETPEFEKALSKYWNHQITRNSIRRTGSDQFLETGTKLSKLGIDKIKQQVQLFLKFCIFEKEDLPLHSFKSNKINLPLRIATRIENPYQETQEVEEEQQMTIDDLKLFCDWLEKKPGYMNQLLLTLIVFLSETGTRFSEAATLKITDITPKGGLFICELRASKTKLRPLILYYSKPYLKNWMGTHPQKNNPNALLFCEKNGSTASYSNILKILKERIGEYEEENKLKLKWPDHKKFHWLRHLMATRTRIGQNNYKNSIWVGKYRAD